MNVLRRPRTSSAHWSVDFVEHLRTVHFALITLSVALILLASNSQNDRLRKAQIQASQILELQQRWDQIPQVLYRQVASAMPLDFSVEPHVGKSAYKRLSLTVRRVVFDQYSEWTVNGRSMTQVPRNLGEFRSWWNALHEGKRLVVPDLWKLSRCVVVSFNRSDPAFVDPTLSGGCLIVAFDAPGTGVQPADASRRGDDFYIGVNNPLTETYKPDEPSMMLVAPGKGISVNEWFMQKIFEDWHKGTFEGAFPELGSVSHQLMTTSMDTLVSVIGEMQHKGDDTLQALGLSIPASMVTQWGTALILSLQLYFWMHLHEINARFNATCPGRDVAWIGVYRSWIAFIVVIISSCVLPLVAVTVLVLRMPSDLAPTGNRYLIPSAMTIATILSGLLALGTAERLRRLRTNLRQPG